MRARPTIPTRAASIALCCAATLGVATGEELPEGVAATVDGREIPTLAVDEVARQLEAGGERADRRALLDELVDMEVLARAAEGAGLDERPEIRTALRLQRVQTLANAWLADASERLEISDEALREEYARQVEGLAPSEFRASHVLLGTEAEAREIVRALEDGADLAGLAAERSLDPAAGGALGWVARGGVDDAIVDALESLAPGEVAPEPVATDFGFHVLRLDAERAATPPDFSAVRPGLRELVLRRRLAERVGALRAEAEVVLP